MEKNENKIKEVAARAVSLSGKAGELTNGTVQWVITLLGMEFTDLFTVLDQWVALLNAKCKTDRIGFAALRENAWKAHGYSTRALYDAYSVARDTLEKDAKYLSKGLVDYWHVDLLRLLVQWVPKGEGDIPPHVGKAHSIINSVLKIRGAKAECAEKGWKTAEDIFRGMDASRLKRLIMEETYEAPKKGQEKTATYGKVLDRLDSALKFVYPGNERDSVLALCAIRLVDPQRGIDMINTIVDMITAADMSLIKKEGNEKFRSKTAMKYTDKDDDADEE
jgi:hypothetical protein